MNFIYTQNFDLEGTWTMYAPFENFIAFQIYAIESPCPAIDIKWKEYL